MSTQAISLLSCGALALALVACSTSSSSSSATPAAASVAAAPAPVAPAPVVATPAPAPTPVVVAASVDFDKQVKPFFDNYCGDCHTGARVRGGVHVDTKAGLTSIAGTTSSSRLYSALTATGRNHMPPQGEDQPSADDIAMIKKWIDAGAQISDSYPPGTPTAAPAPGM